MSLYCPHCKSSVISKNGHIHKGKQKFICLSCRAQFVENPQNKITSQLTAKLAHGNNINPLEKNLGSQVTLKDLTAPYDNDAQGLCEKRYPFPKS